MCVYFSFCVLVSSTTVYGMWALILSFISDYGQLLVLDESHIGLLSSSMWADIVVIALCVLLSEINDDGDDDDEAL